MSYHIRFRDEAESDIQEAYDWYQARRENLGDAFLQAIDDCIEALAEHPKSYEVIHKNIRRALLPHFPYALFFIIEDEFVIVVACFHVRRNPTSWKKRVS
jgi:toxin ParE1/3/4